MGVDFGDWVLERLTGDPKVSDRAGEMVLAALDGDEALGEYLETGGTAVADRLTGDPVVADPEPAAAGAFLAALEVAGFRGIGDRVRLTLKPGPGLTIVCGSNGSGKSSLAEGLEVALTGSTYRWKKRTGQWREHWRNLHDGGSPEVVVTIAEEGRGLTTICTTWAAGVSDADDTTTYVQRAGGKREDRVGLGWTSALDHLSPDDVLRRARGHARGRAERAVRRALASPRGRPAHRRGEAARGRGQGSQAAR